MHPKLVLMTGVTGHIGFRTLIHALNAGYKVRCAVRSQAKAKTILNHRSIQALNTGSNLAFVIVPDLASPCAYDAAARGVRYIIHIASPLQSNRAGPVKEYDAFFIQPAVQGTLNILQAAQKSKTVRRVVITSSMTALIPLDQLTGRTSSRRPVRPTDRVDFEFGPYEDEFAAYTASKVAALGEAEAWIARNSPAFDVIHLHPSFIEGRNDLASNPREALKGTNALILGLALGKQFDSIANATVHNEDVARVHVQALNTAQIRGNRSYILSQPTQWDSVTNIVKREFPQAVKERMLPNCGATRTHEIVLDASETERVFGFTHIGFEEQVKSVVGHYVELKMNSRVSSLNVEIEGQAVGRRVSASA